MIFTTAPLPTCYTVHTEILDHTRRLFGDLHLVTHFVEIPFATEITAVLIFPVLTWKYIFTPQMWGFWPFKYGGQYQRDPLVSHPRVISFRVEWPIARRYGLYQIVWLKKLKMAAADILNFIRSGIAHEAWCRMMSYVHILWFKYL